MTRLVRAELAVGNPDNTWDHEWIDVDGQGVDEYASQSGHDWETVLEWHVDTAWWCNHPDRAVTFLKLLYWRYVDDAE